MGRDTKIEWTNHTVNFWWGCQKVSPGCQHCYAETFSKRVGRDIWGPPQTTERWRTKAPWKDCIKWDKQAKADGIRRKVFCQSMSDFFEDHLQVEPWRQEAFKILESFESLDVQLLTKRPENVLQMVPAHWLKSWPGHIWMGTTAEDQEYYNKRLPELLKIPAPIHFLSCEPLLGPIDLYWCKWCGRFGAHDCETGYSWTETEAQDQVGIDWVITGGESGHSARACHPDWVRSLRDQCQAALLPFFHKQWGEFVPDCQWSQEMGIRSPNWAYNHLFIKVGKKAAGSMLDGQQYKEFPRVAE